LAANVWHHRLELGSQCLWHHRLELGSHVGRSLAANAVLRFLGAWQLAANAVLRLFGAWQLMCLFVVWSLAANAFFFLGKWAGRRSLGIVVRSLATNAFWSHMCVGK
jgi:hypothetical protein